MQYAISLGKRCEPTPSATGNCPCCGQEVIARCGDRKIWHWAHKGRRNCDPWWESETEWHRSWKAMFPLQSQEVVHFDDQTGEKHIADVKISNGTVIEFQHSYIKPEEQRAREDFYKHMIWVVDGTRLKYDYPRFEKAIPQWQQWLLLMRPVYCVAEVFPSAWANRKVPVVFDWGLLDEFVWLHPRQTNEAYQVCWKLDRDLLKSYLTLDWFALTQSNQGIEERKESSTQLLAKSPSFNHSLRQRSRRL